MAKPHQRPLTPPRLDVVEDTNNTFPHHIPSVAHGPWLGHAELSVLDGFGYMRFHMRNI